MFGYNNEINELRQNVAQFQLDELKHYTNNEYLLNAIRMDIEHIKKRLDQLETQSDKKG